MSKGDSAAERGRVATPGAPPTILANPRRSDLRARIIREVGDYYSDKLRVHGATHAGVDWSSAESQRLRFAQLARVCPAAARFALIDYGCGYGAFAEFLAAAGLQVDYHGFDISQSMIAAARDRHLGREGRRFTTSAAELEPADVTVASGVFNVKLDTPDADWHDYVVDTVREMARLSRTSLAWNMLTTYTDADRRRADLHYADPCFWLDFCKRELSPHVALLHDYGLHEFTVLVRLQAGA